MTPIDVRLYEGTVGFTSHRFGKSLAASAKFIPFPGHFHTFAVSTSTHTIINFLFYLYGPTLKIRIGELKRKGKTNVICREPKVSIKFKAMTFKENSSLGLLLVEGSEPETCSSVY